MAVHGKWRYAASAVAIGTVLRDDGGNVFLVREPGLCSSSLYWTENFFSDPIAIFYPGAEALRPILTCSIFAS
jgi:hypothetical protein